MLVRVVRAVVGAVLLLIGLPLLLAGGALWFAMQHQAPTGGYAASLAPVTTDGYAVVASDVDSLLRRDVPFARGGRTSLRLTAHTETGPAFVGLAPAAEVARYLTGVPYARVDQVRLARGPLPVATASVDGAGPPAGPPQEQPFWLASSGAGELEWSPSEVRGQQLALVVMDPAARSPLTVDLTARVHPQWLDSTTLGLLVLGTLLVVVGVAALAWPSRSREIVYVVPPAHVPEVSAHLGVPVPRTTDGALARALPAEPDPAPVGSPRPPAPPAATPAPPAVRLATATVAVPDPVPADADQPAAADQRTDADQPADVPSSGDPATGPPEPRAPAQVPSGVPAAGSGPAGRPARPVLEWPPKDSRPATTAAPSAASPPSA